MASDSPSAITLWRRKNPERARASAKSYWTRNAAKLNAARRAKRNARPSEHRRAEWLRQHYGVSREDAARLALIRQCDACGAPPGRRALHVDHDHSSGLVRGVLCVRCNIALGHVRDNIAALEALIAYLRRVAHAA